MDFTNFVVPNCPNTVIYIPNSITHDEEERILKQIDKTPKPKWTQLSRRRLINYGGIPHLNGMIAEEIPAWLQLFMNKVSNLGIFDKTKKPNHVLINEYKQGQGIMPHTDGPIFYPIICTISCGSYTILEFHKITSDIKGNNENENLNCKKDLYFKLLLEPRSLIVIKEELYSNYMHSISEVTTDLITDDIRNLNYCENNFKFGTKLERTRRISLTIRHVPKTTKCKIKF